MTSSRYLWIASVFAVGCAGVDDVETSTTSQQIWWIEDTDPFSPTWDSGAAPSPTWSSIDCQDASGMQYLANGFQAWREPSFNADDFIAKLALHCRQYSIFEPFVAFGAVDSYMLSSAASRPAEPAISTGAGFVPIGVRLRINSFDGYVKNLALWLGTAQGGDGDGEILNYDAPGTSAWATPYTGSAIDYLRCPSQYVLTRVEVRPTPSSGKIRGVRIRCARVTNY